MSWCVIWPYKHSKKKKLKKKQPNDQIPVCDKTVCTQHVQTISWHSICIQVMPSVSMITLTFKLCVRYTCVWYWAGRKWDSLCVQRESQVSTVGHTAECNIRFNIKIALYCISVSICKGGVMGGITVKSKDIKHSLKMASNEVQRVSFRLCCISITE